MTKHLTLSFVDKASSITFTLSFEQAANLANLLTTAVATTKDHRDGPGLHYGVDKLPVVELRSLLVTPISQLPEITPDHGALFLDPAKYSGSNFKGK